MFPRTPEVATRFCGAASTIPTTPNYGTALPSFTGTGGSLLHLVRRSSPASQGPAHAPRIPHRHRYPPPPADPRSPPISLLTLSHPPPPKGYHSSDGIHTDSLLLSLP